MIGATAAADYRTVNRRAWDGLARTGSTYSSPYGRHDARFARRVLDPHGWLPWRRLRSVLCLACGGGQQGPLFAALGLEVTVADLSPGQLAKDRVEAARLGLAIETVEADMLDLSVLHGRRFDLVFQPVSAIYVPEVRPVYDQVAGLLGPGGLYQVTHWNPTHLQLSDDPSWDGEAYRIDRPQSPGVPRRWTGRLDGEGDVWASCLHFIHPLHELLGGLCDAGFAITGFTEWSPEDADAVPGSQEHLGRYLPSLFTLLARRRARG